MKNSSLNSSCTAFSRREMLRVGGLGMMGLTLPELLAAEEASKPRRIEARADACIILHLNGGPSHLDMWDMKPDGPAESRGEFKPIDSSLSGLPVCEHLPKLARHLHRCTPKINNNDAGRDHWNYCYTVMFAGGGFRRGFVYGASDKAGAFPADRPTTPSHVIATLYHLLGVDHRRRLYDRFDRPHHIVPTGDVVGELLA